jgi:hypothetical protein
MPPRGSPPPEPHTTPTTRPTVWLQRAGVGLTFVYYPAIPVTRVHAFKKKAKKKFLNTQFSVRQGAPQDTTTDIRLYHTQVCLG